MGLKYNKAQSQAIAHNDGPALVIAGAGTGKTAVITARIKRLIEEKNVAAEKILALTFTDKAAAEMQERIDISSSIGFVDSTITTFHSLCSEILRSYGVEIGLSSDFNIIAEHQQAVIMQSVLSRLNIHYHKPQGNPYSFVRSLLGFISRLKDEAISPEEFAKFVEKAKKQINDKDELVRINELGEVYSSYQSELVQKNCLDYGDLLLYSLKLLKTRAEVLKKYQTRFQYILVDEFQDTNFIQNELLKLLSGLHQNLFVVGDDDQSIYRFRGAAISNILSFIQDYPIAKTIVLKNNYRSGQKILDASYSLIQNNNPYRLEHESKIEKRLIAEKPGVEVAYEFYETSTQEASAVAEKIGKLSKTIPLKQMAILLRKNNQAEAFTYALDKKSISYELGQSKKLFEQPLIRAMLSLIRAINDPEDSQALYVVLASQLYKLSSKVLISASSNAVRSHMGLEAYFKDNQHDENIFTLEVNKSINDIDRIRELALQEPAGHILYSYLDNLGIIKELVEASETNHMAVLELQYLSQFFDLIKDFELTVLSPNMYGLGEYFGQMQRSDVDITTDTSPLDQESVQILTIHKAKGLEFRVVFMIDMVEQTFPAIKRSEGIRVPAGLFSDEDDKIAWHLLEERRLCYVGMTRAKDRLFITASSDHGGKRAKKPSRFITEAIGDKAARSAQKGIQSPISYINIPPKTSKSDKFNPTQRYIDADGWLHLSVNQIADYLRSPKEFWYFDVLKLPKGPFHSLVYGSAMHAAIEYLYKQCLENKPPSQKMVEEIFVSSWKSEGFVSYKHEQDRFARGKVVLAKFYKELIKTGDLPKFVEKPFSLRLDELKMVIRGRYDAVFERSDGVEICDFKTGDVADMASAQKKLRDSIQMGIYALAWERTYNTAPTTISLNFLEKALVAKSIPAKPDKILAKLKKVKEGIQNSEFNETGQSQIKFGRLIE